MQQVFGVREKISGVRKQLQSILREGGDKEWKDLLNKAGKMASSIDGVGWTEDPDVLYDAEYATRSREETLVGLQRKLLLLMGMIQGADVPPTSQAVAAIHDQQKALKEVVARWNQLKSVGGELETINKGLQKMNRPMIKSD